MNVAPVGYGNVNNVYSIRPFVQGETTTQVSSVHVMSKEEMQKLMDLVTYNQFGMAEKLARIASQLYAGMNIDYLG